MITEAKLTVTKYRRIIWPKALSDYAERELACDRRCGHVLKTISNNKRIVCIKCQAEWKDEGF